MNNKQISSRLPVVSFDLSRQVQLLSAFLLGITILYAAAFIQTSSVHNAAHDMRHSQGFPCH